MCTKIEQNFSYNYTNKIKHTILSYGIKDGCSKQEVMGRKFSNMRLGGGVILLDDKCWQSSVVIWTVEENDLDIYWPKIISMFYIGI